eukprot:3472623-Ditylum_brightwellii.AAC.1
MSSSTGDQDVAGVPVMVTLTPFMMASVVTARSSRLADVGACKWQYGSVEVGGSGIATIFDAFRM